MLCRTKSNSSKKCRYVYIHIYRLYIIYFNCYFYTFIYLQRFINTWVDRSMNYREINETLLPNSQVQTVRKNFEKVAEVARCKFIPRNRCKLKTTNHRLQILFKNITSDWSGNKINPFPY